MSTCDSCVFPEIEILESNGPDDPLQVGMKVLAPCERCGDLPRDYLDECEVHIRELQDTIVKIEPQRALYHWAPSSRRKQIVRYGLRPNMRSTTTTTSCVPYVCFADDPGWAWALSGGMRWTPAGDWDLWMTYMHLLDQNDVTILPAPDRHTGIHEVRAPHRVFKRHLWLVGSRVK